MPAPVAAAVAAAPAAASALLPFISASAEVAKSAVAQLSIALQQPLWKREVVRPKRRGGLETMTTSVPAWLVVGGAVGGAVAFWLLGLGLTVRDKKIVVAERPRFTLPGASVATFSLFG